MKKTLIHTEMLNRFILPASILVTLFLVSAAVIAGGQRGEGQRGRGQTAAGNEPSPPHDPHDLSGIWVRRGGVLSLSNDAPPFTPEGKKRFDANKPSYGPRAIPPALGNDPMGNCDPLGIPRLLLLENSPGDLEFIQIPGRVIQLFDRHHVHRIHLDRWAGTSERCGSANVGIFGRSLGGGCLGCA